MPDSTLQQIETDIADAERLITELRFKMAVSQSAGEDTTASEARLLDMLRVLLLLQNQRAKASGAGRSSSRPAHKKPRSTADVDQAISTESQADPAPVMAHSIVIEGTPPCGSAAHGEITPRGQGLEDRFSRWK